MQAVTGKNVDILRFVPPELVRLISTVHVLIKPIVQNLLVGVRGVPVGSIDDDRFFTIDGSEMCNDYACYAFRTTFMDHGVNMSLSEYRHVAVALSFYVRTTVPVTPLTDNLADVQTVHSSSVGKFWYGQSASSNTTSPDQELLFRLLSTAWRDYLWPSSIVSKTHAKTPAQTLPSPRQPKVTAILATGPGTEQHLDDHVDVDGDNHITNQITDAAEDVHDSGTHDRSIKIMYSRVYNDGRAEPRSDAIFDALVHILDRSNDVLLVAPTGSGKSITFLGPPFVETATTTVVVSLYRVLYDQHSRTATSKGVDALQWSAGVLTGHLPALLVVSIEDIMSSRLIADLHSLAQAGHLARIVVDEAHLLIEESVFRANMAALPRLRALGVPFVLLSATMSPVLAKTLLTLMRCTGAYVFRLPSTREQARLLLTCFNTRDDMYEHLVNKITAFKDTSTPSQRAIVYAMSKTETIQLATAFHSPAYFGSLSPQERTSSEAKWKQGAQRDDKVMVATSAFGVGVDYHDVCLVIILGDYSCNGLAQKLGRGGRNGNKYECHIMYHPGLENPHNHQSDVWTLVRKSGCITANLALLVDGVRPRPCSLNRAQAPCMYCSPEDATREGAIVSATAAIAGVALGPLRSSLPPQVDRTSAGTGSWSSPSSSKRATDDDIFNAMDAAYSTPPVAWTHALQPPISSASISATGSAFQPATKRSRVAVNAEEARDATHAEMVTKSSLEYKVRSALTTFSGNCAYCFVLGGEYKMCATQRTGFCPRYGYCDRCCSLGHNRSQCTLPTRLDNMCTRCLLPGRDRLVAGDLHPDGTFGMAACPNGAFRNILLLARTAGKLGGSQAFPNQKAWLEYIAQHPHEAMEVFLAIVKK